METTIKFNHKQSCLLEVMKDKLGVKSVTEVVARAMALLEHSLDEMAKGNQICAVNEQDGVKKIFEITSEKSKKEG